MTTRALIRKIVATSVALSFLLPATAWAHAVVYPARSTPAAYERYVLRVPNERDAQTVRIAITFPADVRVISFADVPGWTLEVMHANDGAVTGASWTGRLEAERFVELPFIGVNPSGDAMLSWPVVQEYEGGEIVEWVGPADSDAPASTTIIAAAATEPGGEVGLYLGGAGVLLGLLALGIALRRKE